MTDLVFHHTGLACTDLESEARALASLGFVPESAVFEDPVQGIRGRFLTGPGPRIELVAPLGPGGVLERWLGRGAKLYHLAYLTPDIGRSIEALKADRAKLVVGPVPAVAFDGRPIAFLMLPTMLLVELIQQ